MQHLDRYWETRFLDLRARAHTDLELAQIAAVSQACERGRWANEMAFEADLRVS